MGLRAKLFFWIGFLFLLAAISSYVLPRILIKGDIGTLSDTFDDQLSKDQINQLRLRQGLFQERIADNITLFNATLQYIDTDPEVKKTLDPLMTSDTHTLWSRMGSLLSYNPKIGLISLQNNDINLTINVDSPIYYDAYAITLTNSILLTYLKTNPTALDQQTAGPFIAIRYPFSPQELLIPPSLYLPKTLSQSGANLFKETLYYLYPLKYFQFTKEWEDEIQALMPHLEGVPLQNLTNPKMAEKTLEMLQQIANEVEKLFESEKILNMNDFGKWLTKNESIFDKIDKNKFSSPKQNQTKSLAAKKNLQDQETHFLEKINSQKTLSSDESIDCFCALYKSIIVRNYATTFINAIKTDPFEPLLPIGGVSFSNVSFTNKIQKQDEKGLFGKALLNKEIFFNTPLFNAQQYFTSHLPEEGLPPIARGIATIIPQNPHTLFFGNTLLSLPENILFDMKQNLSLNSTFVTIGSSLLEPIFQTGLSSNEVAAFVDNQGKAFLAFDTHLNSISSQTLSQLNFDKLLDQNYGIINFNQEVNTYIQLENYQRLPLHIFVLTPITSEPIYKLKVKVANILSTIYQNLSYQLLFASLAILGLALIILAFLSKKITKPIVMLAKATEGVAKGNFSLIELPQMETNEQDELYMLTSSFSKMVKGLEEKEKIRGMLDKVVSKEIAEEILKRGNVSLGGESKLATILFADIRGFTKLTEHLDPQDVITNLNSYMTAMTNIIEFEEGIIDKYIGDAIMAIYGAPIEMHDQALKAIKTAILMIQKLNRWNEERVQQGKPKIEIGIGIHTGNVVAGNMGADSRLNYTVLGASVNLASRLCSAAKAMEIRISKDTLEASGMKNSLIYEELPPTEYKGFSEAIVTYTIKGFK